VLAQHKVYIFEIDKGGRPAMAAINQCEIQKRVGVTIIGRKAWQYPLGSVYMLFERNIRGAPLSLQNAWIRSNRCGSGAMLIRSFWL
jgi:hypothetical protein